MTCLGRAERKQPPVKTLQARGEGFKRTVLRGDKIKFLQPIQKGGDGESDGESRSPTCDRRVGTTAMNVRCHSFFPLCFCKNKSGSIHVFSPDPVGLAHAARLFIGGPSHGPSPPDPCASQLKPSNPPSPRRVIEHRHCPTAPRHLPHSTASPQGSDRCRARAVTPAPSPPWHQQKSFEELICWRRQSMRKGLCLFWLSVLVNW